MSPDRRGEGVPAVAAGFRWDETDAGLVLRSEALDPYAHHVCTTRKLEFRDRRPSPDYDRLAGLLMVTPDHLITVTQVHGSIVFTASDEPSREQPDADAIVLSDPQRAATVRVADCVPVLIADRHRRVVAAIHAGWRGTVAAVTRATVRAITELGVPAADLVAAIGPSIGPCCYQVDAAVRDPFLAARPDAARWFHPEAVSPEPEAHWKLDLWQVNADQLVESGLAAANVHVAGLCTFEHPSVCFSFRRDGPAGGRMVAAIRPRV